MKVHRYMYSVESRMLGHDGWNAQHDRMVDETTAHHILKTMRRNHPDNGIEYRAVRHPIGTPEPMPW